MKFLFRLNRIYMNFGKMLKTRCSVKKLHLILWRHVVLKYKSDSISYHLDKHLLMIQILPISAIWPKPQQSRPSSMSVHHESREVKDYMQIKLLCSIQHASDWQNYRSRLVVIMTCHYGCAQI